MKKITEFLCGCIIPFIDWFYKKFNIKEKMRKAEEEEFERFTEKIINTIVQQVEKERA